MPAPSVTFTLVDGTTIRASDHNANFQDLINAMTDGTKDFTINSLVATQGITCSTLTPTTISGNPTFSGSPTVSGNLTLNGNATFGDALTDITTIGGEIRGSRQTFVFGGNPGSADTFLRVGSSSTTESVYKMHRAGSIVGYSVGGTTNSFSSNQAVIFRIRKNGSNFISSATLTWTALNQNQFDTSTIARGTSTFASGDTLSIQYDWQSGSAGILAMCIIEVQFDT